MPADSSLGDTANLMANRAHVELVSALRSGRLASGQFVSMSALVDLLEMPLAATREAVKRASVGGLLEVLPKRGVVVMSAGPEITRQCLDLRTMLDQEGARRLIASDMAPPLDALRASHEAMVTAAEHALTPDLPARAIATDLTLHDALATGLDNALATETYRLNRDRIAIIQNTRPFVADRIVSAMQEHLAIIAAIEDRDAEAAVEAIHVHYRNTLRWWGVSV